MIVLLVACGPDKNEGPSAEDSAAPVDTGETGLVPVWQAGDLAITEIRSLGDGDWVELRNGAARDLDLLGLELTTSQGVSEVLAIATPLAVGQRVVLSLDLDDVADGVRLRMDGVDLDHVEWGGPDAPVCTDDQTLAVDRDHEDAVGNDDMAVWCVGVATPELANAPCSQLDHDGDGLSVDDGDCDDEDPKAYPGGTETWYDGVDGDCLGDDDYDADQDGYANDYLGDDCDDADPDVHPGAIEVCDGVDNDCDGARDASDTVLEGGTWYPDSDGDGWGSDDSYVRSCLDLGDGYLATDGDCDDSDATINPAATDAWYDGVDSDCNGSHDYDQDHDSYDVDVFGGTDCDDLDATIHPRATELCDGVDTDCDGLSDEDDPDMSTRNMHTDADGDGFGETGAPDLVGCALSGYALSNDDCDDTDAGVHPGVTETWYDGVDSDCDGASDDDADGDGYDLGDGASDDCDDTEPLSYPGAPDYLGADGTPCDHTPVLDDLSGWTATVAGTGLGEVLAAVGDIDGDGVGDLLIGLPDADSTLASGAGQMALISGRTDGTVDLETATATFEGENTSDAAGESGLGLVDLDGDGYDELALGASGLDDGAADAGGAYVVYGPVTGETRLADAAALVLGVTSRDTAGRALATVGDWDEDGADELFVGAPNEDTAGSQAGAVYQVGAISSGSSSLSAAAATLLGEAVADRAGTALLGVGDTDGDGIDDLAVGSSGAKVGSTSGYGVVWLVSGPVSGSYDLGGATARLEGATATDNFGASLAALGDEDGDGYADFAVGATGLSYGGTLSEAGGAALFRGPLSGTATADATAFATVDGDIDGAGAGSALAWPGDLDGDGQADLAIGAADDSSGGSSEAGALYLCFGPFEGHRDLSEADEIKVGYDADEHAGAALAAPGDWSGDGRADLVVGTPGRSGVGAVWLLGAP